MSGGHCTALKRNHSRGKDKASDNEILPWRLAEQMGREHEQRVEPPPSLVDTLRYEICWESPLEEFLILEWIMELSVRHAVRQILDAISCKGPCRNCIPSRLEPTIKDFWDPLQLTFSLP